MDDRTLMTPTAPLGETTQMVGSVECPVCHAANSGLTTWCVECGFRLGTEAGETEASEAAFALTGPGERYPLKNGDNAVGRLNADVFMSDSSISRRHAVITVNENRVTVRDEGSSNGTKVAGKKVEAGQSARLRPGQTVEFGTVRLTLEGPAAEDGDEDESVEEEAAAAPPEAPVVATFTDGQTIYPLHEGPNTLGRRADNDVVLEDRFASGRHATLTLENGTATLADSGSTNGTFLSERRLNAGEAEVIPDGTSVRFGQATLLFAWNAAVDAEGPEDPSEESGAADAGPVEAEPAG